MEFGQDQKGQEESAEDVDGDCAFMPSDEGEIVRVLSGILDDGIESLESLNTLGEGFHIVVVFQVEIPDFDDAFASGRCFDVFGGCFAFGSGA